ncbi:MAG: hypothetical protein GF331_18095 [Chitinivibrionales bacterium]|nr:hypothetical protein [Chitinivibrionales bacterium]
MRRWHPATLLFAALLALVIHCSDTSSPEDELSLSVSAVRDTLLLTNYTADPLYYMVVDERAAFMFEWTFDCMFDQWVVAPGTTVTFPISHIFGYRTGCGLPDTAVALVFAWGCNDDTLTDLPMVERAALGPEHRTLPDSFSDRFSSATYGCRNITLYRRNATRSEFIIVEIDTAYLHPIADPFAYSVVHDSTGVRVYYDHYPVNDTTLTDDCVGPCPDSHCMPPPRERWVGVAGTVEIWVSEPIAGTYPAACTASAVLENVELREENGDGVACVSDVELYAILGGQ